MSGLPNGLKPYRLTDDAGLVLPLARRPRVRLIAHEHMNQPCWMVVGRAGRVIVSSAYPTVRLVSGGRVLAHRYAWAEANGREVPDGMVIHHRCFRVNCVNPAHLQAVTFGRNSQLGRWPGDVAA